MTHLFKRCLVAAAAVGLLVAGAAQPASAAPAAPAVQPAVAATDPPGSTWPPYYIWPQSSGKGLRPINNSGANSTQIVQAPIVGVTEEWWHFDVSRTTSAGTWYHLTNSAFVKCMNVQGGSTANSANIILYTCASSNDEWLPMYTGSISGRDYYLLKNYKSGKCLNVQGNSTATNAKIIQYTCNSNSRNEWFTWQTI